MNERIRKLYEQAHESKPVIVVDPVTCQPVHKIGNGGKPMYHRELNLEKFAELLVRECIREIGYKSVELLDIDFYTHYQERLKKHFGVEK